MGTTQPIRDKEELEKFIDYYKTVHPMLRNQTLIVLGLNTALRISDLLNLRWGEVYDFREKKFYSHLFVREKKTGKQNAVVMNTHVKEILENYRRERDPQPEEYVFTRSTDHSMPLSRSQAFRIVKRAAGETLHEPHISCHSLRKTFGYHAWKQGTPPALLMDIYNHSSYRVTKRYLGINQDERDSIFLEIEL